MRAPVEWRLSRWAAVIVLGGALIWDLASVVRLLRPASLARSTPLSLPGVSPIARQPLDDARLYSLAGSHSPFGEGPSVAAQPIPVITPQLPVDQPKLTGTVVNGDSSFVVIELTDGSMRLVHRGERAAGYTLRAVSPGVATFTDSTGRRIVLHASTSETAIKP